MPTGDPPGNVAPSSDAVVSGVGLSGSVSEIVNFFSESSGLIASRSTLSCGTLTRRGNRSSRIGARLV